MSAGSQVCVETELSAQTFLVVLSAAASWDIKSEMEKNPSIHAETEPPVQVKQTDGSRGNHVIETCLLQWWTVVSRPQRRTPSCCQ